MVIEESHPEWRACRQRTEQEKQALHAIEVQRAMYGWVGWPLSGREKSKSAR